MATLSVVDDGMLIVCANPVFPILDPNPGVNTITFEVFEADAASLKRRLGKVENYVLDGPPFFGELISLESCQSTHPSLSLMRDRLTMRGVMKIHETLSTLTQQKSKAN